MYTGALDTRDLLATVAIICLKQQITVSEIMGRKIETKYYNILVTNYHIPRECHQQRYYAIMEAPIN